MPGYFDGMGFPSGFITRLLALRPLLPPMSSEMSLDFPSPLVPGQTPRYKNNPRTQVKAENLTDCHACYALFSLSDKQVPQLPGKGNYTNTDLLLLTSTYRPAPLSVNQPWNKPRHRPSQIPELDILSGT